MTEKIEDNTSDPDVRRLAIINAIDLEKDTALSIILDGFSDAYSSVREAAARAIADFPGEYMLIPLLNLLKDSESNVRIAAADTLSECNLTELGYIYKDWINNSDNFVRSSLLRALRSLRIPEVAPYALKGLEDASESVRLESIGVLGYLQIPDHASSLSDIAINDNCADVRRAAIGAVSYVLNPDTLLAALHCLHDHDWQVRAEAATTISKLRPANICDDLLSSLSSEEQWQVTLKLLLAIGNIKCFHGIYEVARKLAHPVSNVRKEAALCLGEIGNPDAIPDLHTVLLDRDPDVRKIAAWSIAKLSTIQEEK
ncbi:MAG: HEAT repeat domain-containing protein [Acidithiobacillaceae bacterium]|nr:HEAT repeat domain-containing protein [Acidithiobacillaceae bacterium]